MPNSSKAQKVLIIGLDCADPVAIARSCISPPLAPDLKRKNNTKAKPVRAIIPKITIVPIFIKFKLSKNYIFYTDYCAAGVVAG